MKTNGMSTDKIEIVLTHINDERVDLDHMSKEALASFLTVADSFKNISEDLLSDSDIIFSITKGSSCLGVHGTSSDITQLRNSMNEAIQGNSYNLVLTNNLRRIQKEIQKSTLSYKLLCQGHDWAPKVKAAKKITKKRVSRIFDYKLEILTGLFNQIGGNEPNYHLDRGKEDKVTIECTIEEAKMLKDCLYNDISSIVISKKENAKGNKPNYQHCVVLERNEQVRRFRDFFSLYNSKDDIIDRLGCIYDFVYDSKEKEDEVFILLKMFDNKIFNVNEIKTILIISKNMQDQNDRIKVQRDRLLSLFNNLLN